MKKFLGFAAVVVAITLVAFTNVKRATQTFQFVGTAFTQAQVEDITKWDPGALLCNNNNLKACNIITISDQYYHFNGVKDVLNDAAYALANPPELAFSITAATADAGANYYVSLVSSGTPRNKN